MYQNSRAWTFFAALSFAAALAMISAGIIFLPVDIWVKAYLATGMAFLISSCFTLSKTVRDTGDQRDRATRINTTILDRVMLESDMAVR